MIKTSFVTTVLNEEKTIERFLDSLINQTKKPDEIIIVDGGSVDKTVQLIKAKVKKNKKIKLIVKKGATIAQGRNEGIRASKGEVIAMADAGCFIHRDWLEKITAPFEKKKVDIVAGFYHMTGETVFQRCLACYLGILPSKLNLENFMPSARSMAFRKKMWEKIGGFNEKLDWGGEDTLFNYQAKQTNAKFMTVKEALVDWEMPTTWREAIKKFYGYAKGDGQAGIWWHPSQRISTHNLKISAIYARYLLGLAFLVLGFFYQSFWVILGALFFAYLLWAILKNYNNVKAWQAIFILPAIQLISDVAVMIGFIEGSLKKA